MEKQEGGYFDQTFEFPFLVQPRLRLTAKLNGKKRKQYRRIYPMAVPEDDSPLFKAVSSGY